MNLYQKKIPSPVGELTLVTNDQALIAVLWPHEKPGRVRLGRAENDPQHWVLLETEKQLREYFAGQRQQFDLPLAFMTGSAFQREVWKALTRIPFGETRSYSQLAEKLGRPRACRAVGSANGRNPLSIVVPCHRVVGKSGALSGFAGGVEAKRVLLDLEK